MLRITNLLIAIFFSFFSIVLGQDSTHYQRASTIYFKEATNISRIEISSDTTEAFFRIVHKGMETKEKRRQAAKESSKDGKIYPTFYTTFSSVSQPQKIHSLKGINYITIQQYREGNYILPTTVWIIQKLEEGQYLKWKTLRWAQE